MMSTRSGRNLYLEEEDMALGGEDMVEGLDHRVEDPDTTNNPTQADQTQSFMEHVKPVKTNFLTFLITDRPTNM